MMSPTNTPQPSKNGDSVTETNISTGEGDAVLSTEHCGAPDPLKMLHVGTRERHALGLAVEANCDPAGGERLDQLDGGPEPAVEVVGGGEARDPDPGAGREQRGVMIDGFSGQLVALVDEPGCLD